MTQELRIEVGDGAEVSGLFERPEDADCLLVFAHGAGAGMRHAFMEEVAGALSRRRIATLRYQFPYMERGRRAPSPRALLVETVRAAVRCAQDLDATLPLLIGGKSMGGRMSSLAASEGALLGIDTDTHSDTGNGRLEGLVFFGFPLHPAAKPGTERAAHLADITVPMLFLQGTRDKLAELDLLRPVCEKLGAKAQLHIVEGGDHGFQVLKRSGRSHAEVMTEICDRVREFANGLQT